LLARQKQSFDASLIADAGICLESVATAPFTTGLGNEHPLENGFAFLNPYGLPYLPGSGIKGVLRQAARELCSGEWGATHGWNSVAIDALFGRESNNHDSDHLRGALSFWDVLPQIKGDSLMVEIMTPHQGHYFQQKDAAGSSSPHDSGSPIPISFLTVPPGSGFTFHVQCNLEHLGRHLPEFVTDGSWKVLLNAAFEHAFDWLGFGAKTAVGYGAMHALSGEEIAALHAEQLAASLQCAWVDEAISVIAEQNKSSTNDTLRGKLLAQAWAELEDQKLKETALADIRARWQQEGWWDNPPGKASKAAKAIYSGG